MERKGEQRKAKEGKNERKEGEQKNQPLRREPSRALAVAGVPPDAVLAALVMGAVALAVVG